MAHHKPLPFRRRTFLVKYGFQVRFAVYPLLLLALFLLGAGVYLSDHLGLVLRLQLYLPHSRLGNPWEVVSPALYRVAAWGGGAFLLALAVWVWGRFGRLRRDLDRLAEWVAGLVPGAPPGGLPPLAEGEVRVLGEALLHAARQLDAWDNGVASAGEEFARAASRATQRGWADGAADVRRALSQLRQAVGSLRVEEDLG